MRKVFFLTLLFLVSICYSEIIEVDIEGGGDYLSIQSGIESAGFGDVVLVYPGRYYENIDYLGKTISVVSLEWQTGERHYIHETIIDGNQQSSCVCVIESEGNGILLQGFTITNGIGYVFSGNKRYGGGLCIQYSEISITNCIIENNEAYSGGGMSIVYSQVDLAGVTVRYNRAFYQGGGISSGNLYCPIELSNTNRCSIYLNDAPFGKDIKNFLGNGVPYDVIADTLTCWEPFGYDIVQHDDYEQNYEDILLDFNAAKIERIESDLYISPEGNDDNSGISFDDPWRNLSKALRYIKADSLNHRTIHLAEGIYYPVSNGEVFPVTMRDNVSIVGVGKNITIIDLEEETGFLFDRGGSNGYSISDLTIRNGGNGAWNDLMDIYHYEVCLDTLYFDSIQIEDCVYSSFLIMCITPNAIFNGLTLKNNDSGQGITFPNGNSENASLKIINSVFSNNTGCLIFPNNQFYDLPVYLTGCEFTDNNHIYQGVPTGPIGTNYVTIDNVKTNIINCTFSNNSYEGVYTQTAPIRIADGGDLNLINTIIWGNDDLSHSVVFNNAGDTEFMADHNIITGEQQGIYGNPGTMTWHNVTNWDIDPDFVSPEEGNYQLSEGSWAIDRGTLDLPEGVELPEFDAAGRVRIYGDQIDIGAYEWNPWGSDAIEDELTYSDPDLIVYPNPAYVSDLRETGLNIWWQNTSREYIKSAELCIYNISGRKVYESGIEINNQSGITTSWDFRNKYGTDVASALYIVRMKINGSIVGQQKVMVIK